MWHINARKSSKHGKPWQLGDASSKKRTHTELETRTCDSRVCVCLYIFWSQNIKTDRSILFEDSYFTYNLCICFSFYIYYNFVSSPFQIWCVFFFPLLMCLFFCYFLFLFLFLFLCIRHIICVYIRILSYGTIVFIILWSLSVAKIVWQPFKLLSFSFFLSSFVSSIIVALLLSLRLHIHLKNEIIRAYFGYA